MPKLPACVCSGEQPVDGDALRTALSLPGCRLHGVSTHIVLPHAPVRVVLSFSRAHRCCPNCGPIRSCDLADFASIAHVRA
jgi:hypothetical protein